MKIKTGWVLGVLAGAGLAYFVYHMSKNNTVSTDAFNKYYRGYSSLSRTESNYLGTQMVPYEYMAHSHKWDDMTIADSWGLSENGGHALSISGSTWQDLGALDVPDIRGAKQNAYVFGNAVGGSHL